MEERGFVSASRATWERLAASVAEARSRGVAEMGAPELRQMHEDYRQAAADLAYAQTHFPASETAVYLNRLVGQAHGELYGRTPRRLSTLWRFVTTGYPRLVRRNRKPILTAVGVLFGSLALGFLLANVDYPLARLFLPEMFRSAADPAERTAGSGPGASQDILALLAPVLSAGITVNNVQVALVSFAGGVTFGVLTAWSMFSNGMLVGVLAGVAAKTGSSLEFWALIVPHGALELPAIALAGGAGLMLGMALLFPGDLPRLEALRRVSGDAVRILLGTVPLFVVAGIIEGFFTPRGFDPLLKLALGAVLALGLIAYLGLAGRGGEAEPARG